MVQETNGRKTGLLASLDWWTIAIYVALLIFGWVSVCGASYTFGDTDIFSLSTRSGMQIVWMATSIIFRYPDARRPILRHLLVCHLRSVAIVALCHDIQSS